MTDAKKEAASKADAAAEKPKPELSSAFNAHLKAVVFKCSDPNAVLTLNPIVGMGYMNRMYHMTLKPAGSAAAAPTAATSSKAGEALTEAMLRVYGSDRYSSREHKTLEFLSNAAPGFAPRLLHVDLSGSVLSGEQWIVIEFVAGAVDIDVVNTKTNGPQPNRFISEFAKLFRRLHDLKGVPPETPTEAKLARTFTPPRGHRQWRK